MAIGRSPGCGCCGGSCEVADTDAGTTNLTPETLSLTSGSSTITTTKLTDPGYSAAVFIDLTLGAASGVDNVRSITAGDITDFEGLRFELVNDSDVVVAYAEMTTLKEIDLDGEVFSYSNTNSWDPFWSEQSPLVQEVYDVAKVEICVSEQALQFTTYFKYQSGYQWSDSSDAVHDHTDGTPAVGVTLSVPFDHDEDLRVRVKNNGSATMDFTRILVQKNYDNDTTELEDYDATYGYYGCDTESSTYNATCEPCERVCSSLPGNRVHPFAVVSHPFTKTLATATTVNYQNCGYHADSDDYTPTWAMPSKLTADFDSDAVVDPNTASRVSGTIAETYTAGVPATTANPTIAFSLDAEIVSLTECGIVWRFTIAIGGCVYSSLQSSASTHVEKTLSRGTKSYSTTPTYSSPAGPPPNITGTVDVNVPAPTGSDYETNQTVTITEDVEVELWTDQSQLIQIPLASGSPSLLVLFNSLEASPVYETNSDGDYLIEEVKWKHNRTIVDLDGLYLEVRGQ